MLRIIIDLFLFISGSLVIWVVWLVAGYIREYFQPYRPQKHQD